jgi:hypothetical protein
MHAEVVPSLGLTYATEELAVGLQAMMGQPDPAQLPR